MVTCAATMGPNWRLPKGASRITLFKMPIEYPVRHEGRAAFRRILESLAQFEPVAGALAHLYGYTHPSEFERDLERFHREIAESVNSHEERLTSLEGALAPRAAAGALLR